MADVTIYGPSASTYVRTARLACVEKGITHTLGGHRAFANGDYLVGEAQCIAHRAVRRTGDQRQRIL